LAGGSLEGETMAAERFDDSVNIAVTGETYLLTKTKISLFPHKLTLVLYCASKADFLCGLLALGGWSWGVVDEYSSLD
jgi:hypothetical protein